MTVILF